MKRFPSLETYSFKKVGDQKHIISVLKVIYWLVLVFLISNIFTDKNFQGRISIHEKNTYYGNSALDALKSSIIC